jgi:hypothetical protein
MQIFFYFFFWPVSGTFFAATKPRYIKTVPKSGMKDALRGSSVAVNFIFYILWFILCVAK